jgi:hypothetical protein
MAVPQASTINVTLDANLSTYARKRGVPRDKLGKPVDVNSLVSDPDPKVFVLQAIFASDGDTLAQDVHFEVEGATIAVTELVKRLQGPARPAKVQICCPVPASRLCDRHRGSALTVTADVTPGSTETGKQAAWQGPASTACRGTDVHAPTRCMPHSQLVAHAEASCRGRIRRIRSFQADRHDQARRRQEQEMDWAGAVVSCNSVMCLQFIPSPSVCMPA